MSKKLIKLINNERSNAKVLSKKAYDHAYCDSTSSDTCVYIDNAACSVYATDECNKDYAACMEGAWDVCENYRDTDLCIGAGTMDAD